MRLFHSLLSALLLVPVLAAKKAGSDRFDDFHTKSLSSTPLKLSDISYNKLTRAPRDYSVAVLLTALDSRFGCQLCSEFQPEWDLLARSWTKGDKKADSRIIYGTLDFTNGKEIFQSVSRFPSRTLTANACSSDFKQPRSSCCFKPLPALML